ncbi:MAG: hypothetical protein U0169_07045 [Polyangiaceae bacterium]
MLRVARFALFVLPTSALVLAGCSGASEEGPVAGSGDSEAAVVTARCPDTLTAKFESVRTMTIAEIERAEGFEILPQDRDVLEPRIAKLKKLKSYTATLVLEKAENAQCFYASKAASKKTTAKFYTTNGKNVLRIDGKDGSAKDFSFYLDVKTYSKTAIELGKVGAGIAFRDSDPEASFVPRFMGRAGSATLGLSARPAQAGATLTFPLVGREFDERSSEWKDVPLESLNVELAKKRLPPFEKAITVGATGGAAFQKVLDALEKANTALGREIEFQSTWDPSDYVGLCYSGDVGSVIKTIEGLYDTAFPEYLGIEAYRHGSTKEIPGSNESEWLEMREDGSGSDVTAELSKWKTYKTSSEDFLLMANGGEQGDGTELFATTIPKCK